MNLQIIKNVDYTKTQVDELQNVIFAVPDLKRLEVLTNDKKQEVFEFLKIRPLHTVVMTSFIQDNGLENELNRGKYFGYRNANGKLEGVALIGHTTLVEGRSEEAMMAFAIAARQSETPIYVMMSDGNSIEKFWHLYKQDGSQPRLVCTEKLFELKFPLLVQKCEWDVRLAKVDELSQIAEAHAEVAFLESGTNPMEKDREGFLKRCLRRIEKERTFVVFENGKLVFKADVVAETDDVVYLEGVYVSPEYRGKGVAPSCLSKLSVNLLQRVENICMLSNLKFESAHRSFEKAGFTSNDYCTTIFV